MGLWTWGREHSAGAAAAVGGGASIAPALGLRLWVLVYTLVPILEPENEVRSTEWDRFKELSS